ncbi:MAG: hypothetical protein GX640_24680 [Fibrobacter sp.]|nr:hypothetical protein [Fibrobacter sp.]
MPAVHDIFTQYLKLCTYCDLFWKSVFSKYPEQFQCIEGCSSCCELQSVNALEAYSIGINLQKKRLSGSRLNSSQTTCVFLKSDHCEIYAYRPIICRTHGLLLSNSESPRISTCLKNFTNSSIVIDLPYILNTDMLTTNLMKLNIAFCIVCGAKENASMRFNLSDIFSGNIPEFLKDAISL